MSSVAVPAAAKAAAFNTSNTVPAAEAAQSATLIAAAPLPQAGASHQKHHQHPAEHAEPAVSAAMLSGQSHAHLNSNAEHAEFEQLQSKNGVQLPPGIHACAAAASCAEGCPCQKGNKFFSGESKAGACCHDSSSVEEVIGTLLEAGRTMDDIERSGSAAEEAARWGSGKVWVPCFVVKGGPGKGRGRGVGDGGGEQG